MSVNLGVGGDKTSSLSVGPHEIHLDGGQVGVFTSGDQASGSDAGILNSLQKNVDEIDQRLAEMKRTIGDLRTARERKAEKPAK